MKRFMPAAYTPTPKLPPALSFGQQNAVSRLNEMMKKGAFNYDMIDSIGPCTQAFDSSEPMHVKKRKYYGFEDAKLEFTHPSAYTDLYQDLMDMIGIEFTNSLPLLNDKVTIPVVGKRDYQRAKKANEELPVQYMQIPTRDFIKHLSTERTDRLVAAAQAAEQGKKYTTEEQEEDATHKQETPSEWERDMCVVNSKLLLGAMALAGVNIPMKKEILEAVRNDEKIWSNYTPKAQARYLHEVMNAREQASNKWTR